MGFSREGGSFTTVKDYIKSTPTCKSIGYAFAPSPSFVPHSHPFFVSTAVTSSRCEPILIVSNKCSLSFVNRQGTICKTLIYSFYVIIFHLLLADVYRFDLFVILCKMLQYRTILEQNHVFFFFFLQFIYNFLGLSILENIKIQLHRTKRNPPCGSSFTSSCSYNCPK